MRLAIPYSGPEASARTKALLPSGTTVNVELDVEPTDRYGRSLVYLYLRDGTFINSELVRDGFARAKAYKPNVRYKEQFDSLQAEAKANRVGLWGTCVDSSPGKGFDSARGAPVVASSTAPAPQSPRPPRTPAERKQQEEAAAAGSREFMVRAEVELQNPGDVKNCADFASYADAKAWYDRYFPKFGDVAKLDGNGDGVPCEGLLKKDQMASRS